MKRKKILIILVVSMLMTFYSLAQKTSNNELGWKLGIQSYTFHKFTYKEAIDKTRHLGLNYIEVYYGQTLGDGIEGVMDFKMDKKVIKQVKKYAKANQVEIIASGVIICKDETEWQQLFIFAKKMGISIITCEPEYHHLKFVDELANKYKIDVAIHNHPKPSNYWKPEMFLEATKGLSDRIGVCADVGHWARMGLDPVDCLRKCSGKVKSLHFKDIIEENNTSEERHDIIWGKGSLDLVGMLEELKKQNFEGLFSIEYEHNWSNSVPDIAESITYFEKTIKENLK